MKIYINYSDENFKKQQKFAFKMAKIRGGFDKLIMYTPHDVDKEFQNKYRKILNQKRGGGYWLWKPYLINKTLEQLNVGDYLFYSDAGAFFIRNVDYLIKEMEELKQDIMGFELPLIEKQWTKQELFINLELTEKKFCESNQIFATFMLIKKTDFSMKFFNEFLECCCNEINLTDKYDNKIKQIKIFIDHRHDQSIFSLLYKKYNLKPFKDPSQLGKYPGGYSIEKYHDFEDRKIYSLKDTREFRNNGLTAKYPMVLYVNKKGHPIESYLRFKKREILYNLGLYKSIVR